MCQRTVRQAHVAISCESAPLSRWKDAPLEPLMNMNLHLSLGPLVSLIAGILILLVPRLLNYIVAIYLIVMGLLGLFGATGGLHLR